ncbi:MAG: amino acid ABC transporter substrate-binding protein [Betaproteobacteria bacterium]|nr:MAG: amino acid ABC transporter substrate-binding protein [Betaproteobacteria bacterium]
MMRKLFSILVLGVLAAVPITLPQLSQADTLLAIQERGEFVIGHRESSFPLSFVDENGTAAGYSVEICTRVFEAVKAAIKRPNLRVRYVPISPSDRIPAITNRRIDIECGSTTNTDDRRKHVEFSYTTFMAGARVLVRADSTVAKLADLRGKRVAVTTNTTMEDVVRRLDASYGLDLRIEKAADHAASFALLKTGRVDALVNDDINLLGLVRREQNANGFRFVGKNISAEPLAIMYRKGDSRYASVVDGAVASLFYSREIFSIYSKWFETGTLQIPMSLHMRENVKFPNKHGAL